MRATNADIAHLNSLYEGRAPYHGELHDHASTGGTSDGKRTLEHWKGAMEALEIDFAAILDHRQVRHMYLPEWDNTLFICGTEPGAVISDSMATQKELHYNMIFPSPKELEGLLEAFPEYEFTKGPEGHFKYPAFTRERFGELIDYIKAHGGFFVHPHPKQQMKSEYPIDYWFRDETAIEVFYIDIAHEASRQNYELWTTLLDMGKRLYASAGGDLHRCAHDMSLTTIYSEEKINTAYLPHLRAGDFTAGHVGIRMCIGDTRMGGICDFGGKRLVISTESFHKYVRNPEHEYRLDIIRDNKVIASEKIGVDETAYFALDVDKDARFYRAEVVDVNRDLRIAIGNPIFNIAKY